MDTFECLICYEDLKDPRVIGCGHTFCRECLSSLKTKVCPLCRHGFRAAQNLPRNFLVINWMQQREKNPPKPTPTPTPGTDTPTPEPLTKSGSEYFCGACEKTPKPATTYCENCKTHFCSDCDLADHSRKVSAKHVRIPIRQKATKNPVFPICKQHNREQNLFCVDDRVFVCDACAKYSHGPHNVMDIYKYADVLKEELKQCVKPLQNKKPLELLAADIKDTMDKTEKELLKLEEMKKSLLAKREQSDQDLKDLNERIEKVQTSEVVLIKSIEDLTLSDIMNQPKIDTIKSQIKEAITHIYPEHQPEAVKNLVFAIGDVSVGEYPGFRRMTIDEVMTREKEILTYYEKFGGLLCLDSFKATQVISGAEGFLHSNQRKWIQAGPAVPTFLEKGSHVSLFEYRTQPPRPLPRLAPFDVQKGAGSTSEGTPTLFISVD